MMEYLIAVEENIVGVEFYYEVVEKEEGFSLVLKEEIRGYTINAGTFETKKEAVAKAKEIASKILQLVEYERSLNIF